MRSAGHRLRLHDPGKCEQSERTDEAVIEEQQHVSIGAYETVFPLEKRESAEENDSRPKHGPGGAGKPKQSDARDMNQKRREA